MQYARLRPKRPRRGPAGRRSDHHTSLRGVVGTKPESCIRITEGECDQFDPRNGGSDVLPACRRPGCRPAPTASLPPPVQHRRRVDGAAREAGHAWLRDDAKLFSVICQDAGKLPAPRATRREVLWWAARARRPSGDRLYLEKPVARGTFTETRADRPARTPSCGRCPAAIRCPPGAHLTGASSDDAPGRCVGQIPPVRALGAARVRRAYMDVSQPPRPKSTASSLELFAGVCHFADDQASAATSATGGPLAGRPSPRQSRRS